MTSRRAERRARERALQEAKAPRPQFPVEGSYHNFAPQKPQLELISNGWMDKVVDIFDLLNNLTKSAGILLGGVLASGADWIFGAVTIASLMVGSEYLPVKAEYVGVVISGAMWGIQLMLWQLLLSNRAIEALSNKRFWKIDKVLLAVLILGMKLGDDFIDVSSLNWLINPNSYQGVMDLPAFEFLLMVIRFVIWVVTGFSELFIAISLSLLKRGRK